MAYYKFNVIHQHRAFLSLRRFSSHRINSPQELGVSVFLSPPGCPKGSNQQRSSEIVSKRSRKENKPYGECYMKSVCRPLAGLWTRVHVRLARGGGGQKRKWGRDLILQRQGWVIQGVLQRSIPSVSTACRR